MRERHRTGSLVFDRARGTWRFLQWVDGKRKSQTIGTKLAFPTKTAAWKKVACNAAKPLTRVGTAPTVATLVEEYRNEKMPKRLDTNRGYESWIGVHILPRWGRNVITDLQARPVEMWLNSLALAPKSRAHIRGILSSLWKFAMWKQDVPMQVNPIDLVTVKGASKRIRHPRSLTVEQFRLSSIAMVRRRLVERVTSRRAWHRRAACR